MSDSASWNARQLLAAAEEALSAGNTDTALSLLWAVGERNPSLHEKEVALELLERAQRSAARAP